MKLARSIAEVRAAVAQSRTDDITVGFVPTMGALHEGHLSLIRAARDLADVVVVSIFVNPLQFGPHEDFSRYPRDEEKDLRLAGEEKADIVFLPPVEEIYPPRADVRVEAGELGSILEGAIRPGHFDGVCTVVAKLFNIVQPDFAFFGQKDAQQVAVIKRMVRDLSFSTRIEVCPIVREPDGLALSSRNAYLSEEERARAPALHVALQRGAEVVRSGGRREDVEDAMAEILRAEGIALDYAAVVHPEDFTTWSSGDALLLVAARLGGTRLIDNLIERAGTSKDGDTR
jgi:pantoate--beta-alanine ligase